MVRWRTVTWIGLLLCLNLTLSASAQTQLTLSPQELWQYGRGVIYDFDWSDQHITLSTSNGIWQLGPTSDEPPTKTAREFFPASRSSDGMRFLTQGRGEILIGDALTGAIITRIPRSYTDDGSTAWRPNTRQLTTVGYNEDNPPDRQYYVELWDADGGELMTTFGGYADRIKALSWHPAGEMLAVSLVSDRIIIEDVARDERGRELIVSTTAAAVAWSPDGSKLVATANSQSPVNLWRTDTFEAISTPNQPIFILSLAWNADSTQLAGSLVGSGIGVWNIETDEVIASGVEPDDGVDRIVNHIAWQGEWLAALDYTQRLRVWNADTNGLMWDSTQNQFHSDIRGMAVSQDGALVALGYYNSRAIDILDGRTGTLIQTLEAPRRLDITEMAWSPSGQQLAVASTTLYLWSFQTDAPTNPLEVADVNYVSWSPDGLLAVASTYHLSGELRVINGQTGEEIESREMPRAVVFPRWSPDGRYIAVYRYNAPSDDDSIPTAQIDIWDRQRDVTTTVNLPFSGQCRITPSEYFVWLPDSSGLMGYARGALWRWRIGATEGEILVPCPPIDTTNQAFPLSINARGDLLAVSNPTTEGQVHILDAASGRPIPLVENVPIMRYPFSWGGDDMLFVLDGVLRTYQIS